jgi:hypothetical protein
MNPGKQNGGNPMNEELRREDDQSRYGGLTTAPLTAAAGAPALGDHSIPPNGGAANGATEEQATPLFASNEAKEFRVRWDTIQGGFVDEPRHAVEQADILVTAAMKRLAEIFSEERTKLEGQWDREETISTENLRLALRRYRSFFGRLLSV